MRIRLSQTGRFRGSALSLARNLYIGLQFSWIFGLAFIGITALNLFPGTDHSIPRLNGSKVVHIQFDQLWPTGQLFFSNRSYDHRDGITYLLVLDLLVLLSYALFAAARRTNIRGNGGDDLTP